MDLNGSLIKTDNGHICHKKNPMANLLYFKEQIDRILSHTCE